MSDRRTQPNQRRNQGQKVSPEAAAAAAEQFLAAIKVSEQRDKARRERDRAERVERERVEGERRAHDRALADAQRALERAITDVRRAKDSGKGRAEADAAWKVAKARVIELETGVAPAWAPVPEASDVTVAEASATNDEVDSAELAEGAADPQ